MKRPRFVEHYTIETKSDHRAVVAVFALWRSRGRDRQLVRIGTWNAGRGTRANLLEILGQVNVLAGQEWGDRGDLTRAAQLAGFRAVRGTLRGSSSTPVFVGPGVKIGWTRTILLLGRRFIGPGAGPAFNKQKDAVEVRCKLRGARFGAASHHVVPTQGRPLRRAAAETMFGRIRVAYAERVAPWFVCGDGNTVPDAPQLDVLYRHGWTNNHREGGALATHGRRPIDYVWWLKKVH